MRFQDLLKIKKAPIPLQYNTSMGVGTSFLLDQCNYKKSGSDPQYINTSTHQGSDSLAKG